MVPMIMVHFHTAYVLNLINLSSESSFKQTACIVLNSRFAINAKQYQLHTDEVMVQSRYRWATSTGNTRHADCNDGSHIAELAFGLDMPADDSPAMLVARFLRSNNYNEVRTARTV